MFDPFIHVDSLDAQTRPFQGALLSPGTTGGLLPVCLTVDVSVFVAVPVGVLIWVSGFTLLSSAHPVIPIPIAATVKTRHRSSHELSHGFL